MPNKNAPGRKAEGVVCQLPGDTDVHSTAQARVQYLTRLGLHFTRAAIVAPLVFGEAFR